MKLKQTLPIARDIISLVELKFLMNSIIHHHAKIRIKCLLEGGKWSRRFLSVMMITEKGLVLSDDLSDRIESINFPRTITQFVIDKPFDNYRANLVYLVS